MSIYPEKLGYVCAKKETTYNTDPTVAIPADLLYCEDLSHEVNYTMIARTGESPKRAGFKMVKGPLDAPISLAVELDQFSVVDATSLPVCDPILHCCGFERTASVGGDNKTQTYLLQTAGHGSTWFEIAEVNEDEDDVIKYTYGGVRGDFSLTIAGEDRWMFSMDGNAASATDPARTGSGPAAGVDFDGNLCALPAGTQGIVTISVVEDSTTYPVASALLHSAEFQGNMNLQAKNGVNGRQVKLVPVDPIGGSLSLEQVDLNEGFNPWDIRNESKVLLITLYSQDLTWTGFTPAVDGQYMIISGTFVCSEFSKGLNLGARTWDLTLAGSYPDDSSDGGGLDPVDDFKIIFGEYTAP